MSIHRLAGLAALIVLLMGCSVTTYQIGGTGPEYEANWRWCYGNYTTLCSDAHKLAVQNKAGEAFVKIEEALGRGGFYDGNEHADLLYDRAILQLHFGRIDAAIASLEEAREVLPKGASRAAFDRKLAEIRKATGR